MQKDEKISQLLYKLVSPYLGRSPEFGTVVSVDSDKLTCVVAPADENKADLTDVRLNAVSESQEKPIVCLPKVNSVVLVAFIENNHDEAFVAMMSEVDEVRLRGDAYGGLIKWESLKADLDKVNNLVGAMKQAFTQWSPVSQDGGAALKAILSPQLSGKNLPTYTNITNEKVTHG